VRRGGPVALRVVDLDHLLNEVDGLLQILPSVLPPVAINVPERLRVQVGHIIGDYIVPVLNATVVVLTADLLVICAHGSMLSAM
jgi:hypothetical protein